MVAFLSPSWNRERVKSLEIVAVASGKTTKAERLGQRDFCIFKVNTNI